MNNNLRNKQQGATMLLTIVFLIGLFAAIALATDSGNLVTHKTRLQNAVDAAVLSAAITLNTSGGNQAAATQAGQATFTEFAAGDGNSQLSTVSDLAFNYGDTLNPLHRQEQQPLS